MQYNDYSLALVKSKISRYIKKKYSVLIPLIRDRFNFLDKWICFRFIVRSFNLKSFKLVLIAKIYNMQVLREMNGKKSNIIKINKSKPLFFVWKLKLETENKSIVLPWTPQLLSLFEYYCIYCLIGVWFHSCCTTFPSSCFSSFWLLASLRWRERFVCTVDHKTSDWTYEFLHMKLHSGILAHAFFFIQVLTIHVF
jgi:hypothetical protein